VIEIIHADALTLDAEFFAEFDALIVAPPYSAHVHENPVSCAATNGESLGVRSRDFGFGCLTPELRAHVALAAGCVRRWSLVFSDFEGAHAWREAVRAEYVRTVPATALADVDFELPWVRWSQPQLSGDRPGSGAEAVLHFHRDARGPRGGVKPLAKHWNGPGNLTHYARRSLRGEDKHPTEKPLDLLLDLVSWFSDPGEAVLDLCAGAGTTALACRLLGRECIAVEQDARWAAEAKRRVTHGLSGRDRMRAEVAAVYADKSSTDGAKRRADARDADARRVEEALA
jgi:hypothetical protein